MCTKIANPAKHLNEGVVLVIKFLFFMCLSICKLDLQITKVGLSVFNKCGNTNLNAFFFFFWKSLAQFPQIMSPPIETKH